jgi:hypothetical protein
MRVVAMSSDLLRMAVDVGHVDGEVWDLQTGSVLAVLPLGGKIAFSDDNESLTETTESGVVDLLYLGPTKRSPAFMGVGGSVVNVHSGTRGYQGVANGRGCCARH